MCAKIKTQYIVLVSTLTALAFSSNAQTTSLADPKSSKEISPYSRYGIGLLSDNKQATVRGAGGTASGYIDPIGVNSYNPASYSFLAATALEFGIEARSRNILMNNQSVTSGTLTISYFNLGFSAGKHAGFSVGFTPLSNIYYLTSDSASVPGLGTVGNNYEGKGSLQYAYFGLAGKVKGLSAGFNFGYAFGNLRNTSTMYVIDTLAPARSAEFTTRNSMGGIYWKGGLMYKADIKKNRYLNIGATATLSQNLNINRDEYQIARSYDYDNQLITRDTVNRHYGAKGKLTLPAEYSIGVHVGKQFNWDVGVDFVYSDWKNYRNFGLRDSVADAAWRLGAGAEITPDPAAKGKYFSTVTYRLGAYYGKDYISMRGTQIGYMGATLGLSFPFKRSNTNNQIGRIHTSLDIGRRGTVDNGLAREFFTKFTLAFSLNDIWFKKYRID
jgi:hypothetical protein